MSFVSILPHAFHLLRGPHSRLPIDCGTEEMIGPVGINCTAVTEKYLLLAQAIAPTLGWEIFRG
jgi:hypothetical protein